jgi:hypothetical protein
VRQETSNAHIALRVSRRLAGSSRGSLEAAQTYFPFFGSMHVEALPKCTVFVQRTGFPVLVYWLKNGANLVERGASKTAKTRWSSVYLAAGYFWLRYYHWTFAGRRH